jgi:flagellar motor switch protein FliN/FliY
MVAGTSEIFMAESPSENLEQSAVAAPVEVVAAPEASAAETGIDAELNRLPMYARGLLQIRVPVRVTLASQRKSIQEIIELGPGSIVKFDKTCDEPLELCVGDRPIAHGEVVKVGDKFGLKISGLVK